MNRKDFKSAYDKITLSDECRAEMKNKLMAAMEQEFLRRIRGRRAAPLHAGNKARPEEAQRRENRRDSRFGGGSHRGVRSGGGRNAQPERHASAAAGDLKRHA